jgi:hypothetical protein
LFNLVRCIDYSANKSRKIIDLRYGVYFIEQEYFEALAQEWQSFIIFVLLSDLLPFEVV